MKSNGDNGSPYVKPFLTGNMSERCNRIHSYTFL